MTCFIGIDYGSKRIGLAVGAEQAGLATPLTTLEVRAELAEQVQAVIARTGDYDVDAFVVGLPLNMDDTEGPQAQLVRSFGSALAQATGLPVHYWDERLSSVAAEELLQGADLTHAKKKRRRDRIAAQVILQEFLDSRSDRPAPPSESQ